MTMPPTFYTGFPVETSPLNHRHRSAPGLAEHWDLVVAGMEVGTAYSELTDPLDQCARLIEQSMRAAAGDPEAMEVMFVRNTAMRSVLTVSFVRPDPAARGIRGVSAPWR